MAESSPIGWLATVAPDGTVHAGHTFNTWSGCTKISEGCRFCYAAALPPSMRRHAVWGDGHPRILASPSYLRSPFGWARRGAGLGIRPKVFAHSTSDVFEDRDDLDPWRELLFSVIELTPELDWIVLTKRADVILRRQPARWASGWPSNVWLLVSAENQEQLDRRVPHLLKVPARVLGVSAEPLLGPIDLRGYVEPTLIERAAGHLSRRRYPLSGIAEHRRLDWVIVGGESGRGARPMHPQWARSLRDQCTSAGVPFFFKQWGEWADNQPPHEMEVHTPRWLFGDGTAVWRLGKGAAGRLLDGREWSEFPRV